MLLLKKPKQPIGSRTKYLKFKKNLIIIKIIKRYTWNHCHILS